MSEDTTMETSPSNMSKRYKYSVIRDGKLVEASDCIHVARKAASNQAAELWRRGGEGHADIQVPL